ncbi:glutamate carboxypeptidase 2-like isoform X3 [Dreissena polymorpha]|uniref:glutamate carboxypeptidase 2-like isoform X3 n=1 Tax=Dreissena polymorpha TaxID=45954 RepID=UPI0022644170|nr:glutamate carboxypeptidase 2-like isoform X3 [Dreissena polymorpha]
MYDIHSSDDDAYLARRRPRDTRCLIIATIAAVIVAFVIGILIGRFAACPEPEVGNDVTGGFPESANYSWMKDGDPTISRLLIDGMKAENIRSNLKMLTEKPHLSGTEQNHELGRKLTEFWTEVGLDHVTLTPYKVQLSYPNETSLSYVELLDGNGNSVYKSNLTEPVLTPEENKPDVVPPFNAYSPPGNITGEIVYLNYGRVEDHLYLERNTSLTVKGKIVLVRYGKIFRGDKVRQAEKRGAIGVILFSDPDDITSGIVDKVYPDDWWLPPSGAQRGSIYLGVGDPLTPGYPAIESAYRKKDPDEYMPGIPCHPVGYGIAVKIMEALAGIEVPIDWRGKMNVTYKFGGSFNTNGWKAHIFVSTAPKMVTTYNAFGIIRGAVEPDRYVLVGNHRDAWVFGALDPSSGTAAMMEMSRVMGNLLKSGKWRPRRSIVFCSWGAEEYGLVGSIEWVEHYTKVLCYIYHSNQTTWWTISALHQGAMLYIPLTPDDMVDYFSTTPRCWVLALWPISTSTSPWKVTSHCARSVRPCSTSRCIRRQGKFPTPTRRKWRLAGPRCTTRGLIHSRGRHMTDPKSISLGPEATTRHFETASGSQILISGTPGTRFVLKRLQLCTTTTSYVKRNLDTEPNAFAESSHPRVA